MTTERQFDDMLFAVYAGAGRHITLFLCLELQLLRLSTEDFQQGWATLLQRTVDEWKQLDIGKDEASPCAICTYYDTNNCVSCRLPEQDRLPTVNDPVKQGKELKRVLAKIDKENN